MPKFKVTATMDVGYTAIIEADTKDKAWAIASNGDEADWEQTDNGHDWTLENIREVEDDDLQEIPPHEKFEVSQAANNDVRTDIDGLTKEEVEAIDEKISDYEADGLTISEIEKRFLRMHEAHHLRVEKFHAEYGKQIKYIQEELASVSPSANFVECEQGQMGAGKSDYIFDPTIDKIEFPSEPLNEKIVEYAKTNAPKLINKILDERLEKQQKHKSNPPRNPFASETQSIKGHKSRK